MSFYYMLKFRWLQHLLLNETMPLISHLKTAWKWSSWSVVWEQDGTNACLFLVRYSRAILSSVISLVVLPALPSLSLTVLLNVPMVLSNWLFDTNLLQLALTRRMCFTSLLNNLKTASPSTARNRGNSSVHWWAPNTKIVIRKISPVHTSPPHPTPPHPTPFLTTICHVSLNKECWGLSTS